MADVTLTYKGQNILELSASGSKTIQTKEKYCEDNITLIYSLPDEILYNPSFNINTTGLVSWDASHSGTGISQGVKAIDGWYIMNSTAAQYASGLSVTPKQSTAFLLQEINSYFVRKTLTLSVTVDNTEYHLTDVINGTSSMGIETPWGDIYVYSYGAQQFFITIHFQDQVDVSHIVNNVSLKVA